ncbi:circadian clock-controlled protein daywake-like [Chrysoperla carnea]|uniref:circadian clock-controlled protein daywake-like n=1 Tax=Chrysoperla carnea TaxID=189513 RepID=UPI001D0640E7|nr:circadian clock-controlled protein daywake-like [Chrysoperla carnea]
MLIFLSLFIISTFITQLNAANFVTPEYVIPCNKSDPDINACILGSFNHLRPYLIRGIPDIQVPSIEPMIIPRLVMENNAGAVRVKALFVNNTIFGSSNYTIQSLNADIDTWRINIILSLPRIEVKGKYEVIGQILLFPVRSKGDFWAAFGDVSAKVELFGKIVKNKENVRFMKIDNLLVDFKLQKSKFKIRDQVNHANVIGQAMNQFLNQNANEIIQEMKPAASASISRYFKAFLNSAFLKIPLEVWLHGA